MTYIYIYWLVVWTILNNISQWEGLSHISWNIKNYETTNHYIYMYQTRGLQSNLLGGWALFGGWVHWQWLMTSLLRSHPGITGGFVVSMWNDAMFNGINHPSDSSKKMRFSTLLSHAAPEIHHHSTIPSHCEVMIKFIHWFQPLWNILVSWDDYSQYMKK